MREQMLKNEKQLLLQQKKRKHRHRIVGILSCIVVFCTTYALVLPAITMERTVYCGQEEHRHDGSCYIRELACELPTEQIIPGHTHTEECYRQEEVLICGQEEGESHTHTEACYDREKTLICGQDEKPETVEVIHEHTEACYKDVLVCTLEEHTHSDACYQEPDAATEPVTDEENAVSEAAQESEAPEAEPLLLTAAGEDYTITVRYTQTAAIPEGAKLQVSEYAADSEEYQARFREANQALLDQGDSCIYRARFFDISIVDGEREIEPADTVQVEISQSPELTESAEDMVITHATDEGTEVISGVAMNREENGYLTASFETDSFSDYGTISAGESVQISVGDTVTLQGSSSAGNTNEWTASPEGNVTFRTEGDNAVVTGAAAGTVTVTHTYNYKKNKTTQETFTVIVTETESPAEEAEVANEETGCTITVKGNAKILRDAELFVEEMDIAEHGEYYSAMVEDMESTLSTDVADASSDFSFLKMYHIYLSKDGGATEYDPAADETLGDMNVNLQVTITYDTAPEGWPAGNGNLYVGHYKKNGNLIENKGFVDAAGIKRIKVSGNSVTFHIKGFSVITAGVPYASSLSGGAGSGKTEPNSIAAEQNLAQLAVAANRWQVVDGLYDGNEAEDKAVDTHDAVRIQKNVVPTGTENEFKIYLSVDYNRDAMISYLLQKSGMAIKTSGNVSVGDEENNTSHAQHFEEAWESGGVSESNTMIALPERTDTHTNPFTFTITAFGKSYSVVRYTSNNSFNNGRAALRLAKNDWLIIAMAEKGATTFEGTLTDEQATKIIESSIGTQVGSLLDDMGTGITVTSLDKYTGTATISSEGSNIDWSHLIAADHLTLEDGWYINAAEMVYTVKLDPTVSTGLEENTHTIASASDGTENVKTNSQASLNYMYPDSSGNVTKASFSVESPVVRGMLYAVSVKKTDTSGNALEGASFGLYTSASADGTPVATATSDADGLAIFSEVEPDTAYWLKELEKMDGYRDNTQIYSLGQIADYTASPTAFLGQGPNQPAMYQGTGENGTVLMVQNEPEGHTVILRKTDSQGMGRYLSGAEFEIYNQDKATPAGTLQPSDEDGYITPKEGILLPRGVYYLREKKAPAGYTLPDGDFQLVVTESGAALYMYNESAQEHYGAGDRKDFQADEEGAVEVTIANNPARSLPSTGGPGTILYTCGGWGLVLISGLMYRYRRRRRREGRFIQRR